MKNPFPYTPGPFRIVPAERPGETALVICAGKDYDVGIAWLFTSSTNAFGHQRATTLPQQANARLLAAAPEAIEALRRFQLSFSSLVNSTDLPPAAEAIVRNFMQQAFEYSLRVTQKVDGEE